MNNTKITLLQDEESINIRIPIGLMVWAAEKNPDDPIKVVDAAAFAKCVMKIMEDVGYQEGEVITHFEHFLDEAYLMVLENGEDCVEPVEDY